MKSIKVLGLEVWRYLHTSFMLSNFDPKYSNLNVVPMPNKFADFPPKLYKNNVQIQWDWVSWNISVTKWCIVGYGTGALWVNCNGVYGRICYCKTMLNKMRDMTLTFFKRFINLHFIQYIFNLFPAYFHYNFQHFLYLGKDERDFQW